MVNHLLLVEDLLAGSADVASVDYDLGAGYAVPADLIAGLVDEVMAVATDHLEFGLRSGAFHTSQGDLGSSEVERFVVHGYSPVSASAGVEVTSHVLGFTGEEHEFLA